MGTLICCGLLYVILLYKCFKEKKAGSPSTARACYGAVSRIRSPCESGRNCHTLPQEIRDLNKKSRPAPHAPAYYPAFVRSRGQTPNAAKAVCLSFRNTDKFKDLNKKSRQPQHRTRLLRCCFPDSQSLRKRSGCLSGILINLRI